MPIELGRRIRPVWDALRVNTLSGVVTSDAGGGAGLENKIVVWHADGSSLGLFNPDAAGFASALATCAWGDVLEIPAVEITLTAGITLVAGMALIGKGENSILSFGGFSGAAITMAKWAVIWNLGIKQVSNGADSLGIDGRFSSVTIAPCFIQVSGGSGTNVGVKIGA